MTGRVWLLIEAVVCTVALGRTGAAQCAPGFRPPAATRESLLVSPAWLEQRRQDPRVVIVHVAHDRAEYTAGHIPGARFADMHGFISMAGPGVELPPPAMLDSVVESLGISDDSRVVIYGSPWITGRVFLAFDYLGHPGQAALLDGGLSAWKSGGRPVATAAAGLVRRGTFTPRPQPEIVVDAAWVRQHLRDPRVAVVDGRSAEEYAGPTDKEQLRRYGHLPGARRLDWTSTFTVPDSAEQGKGSPLRSAAELRGLFRAAGASTENQVVTYCTVGLRASHLYFVARYLGYSPKIYDGSMADWSTRPELPLATGPARGQP